MKKVLVTCHVGRHYRKFGHYDIETLLELGYEVHFAANFKLEIDKVNDERIKLHQVDFSRNPFSPKNIKAYLQIKKIIQNYDFELIHCQSPVGGVLTRLAGRKAKKNGTKIIYTAHGFHFFKGSSFAYWFLFYPVEKILSKYADEIVTINLEDYNLASTKFKKTNVNYIPGIGLDIDKFNYDLSKTKYQNLRKSLGLKKTDFVIIYPARLDKNKNQIFLIKVMEDITKKYNNIHLLLVGNDEFNRKYHKIVERKNLQKNIHFLGFRTDVSDLLKISDLAVSSSLREGLPVNVMEAIASKVPVIVTKCRGMEDLLGVNSQFIVNDEKEFINNIIKFYNHEFDIEYIVNDNYNKLQKFSNKNVSVIVKKIFKRR